jgi:diguanylate cyclase (GGDEF)-like protein
MMDSAFLQKVGIFSLLDGDDIGVVSGHLSEVPLKRGDVLFREGDKGHTLYILKAGVVSICIALPGGSEQEVAKFGVGDFFGDMAIFDNAPRSASCKALEDSVLFSLSKDTFSHIISSHPRIALKLIYRMLNVTTQRLRSTSEFVADMVMWGESARKRAVTDELTGVYNRRFLDDSLPNYLAEAKEKGEPLSLVMVDLDRFREINELYGAEKGDKVIGEAVRIFKKLLRPKDVIARYGGDEFVIILPETGSEEATSSASAICVELARLELLKELNGPITRVSASMGVAAFPEHAVELKELRGAADAALYKAKERGRNRVVRAGT